MQKYLKCPALPDRLSPSQDGTGDFVTEFGRKNSNSLRIVQDHSAGFSHHMFTDSVHFPSIFPPIFRLFSRSFFGYFPPIFRLFPAHFPLVLSCRVEPSEVKFKRNLRIFIFPSPPPALKG